MMNTAAIRIAKTVRSVYVARRPRLQTPDDTSVVPFLPAADTSPPASADDANSMATKRMPLPRNTVAKNRSSASPMRSRTTPMNQRNAMPANGTSPSPNRTECLVELSVSSLPASSGFAGSARRMSTRAVIRSTEKTMPASAAARGVRIAALVALSAGRSDRSHRSASPGSHSTSGIRCPLKASNQSPSGRPYEPIHDETSPGPDEIAAEP